MINYRGRRGTMFPAAEAALVSRSQTPLRPATRHDILCARSKSLAGHLRVSATSPAAMPIDTSMIPPFDEFGCLPPGIHPATLAEIDARLGHQSELRHVQMESVRGVV